MTSTKPKTVRCANKDADGPISRHQPFQGYGSMSGEVYEDGFPYWSVSGYLPSDYDVHGATYVVFSYDTPIAWFKGGEWHMPRRTYSVTTSAHQSTARQGIHRSGEPTHAEGTHAVVREFKTNRGATQFIGRTQEYESRHAQIRGLSTDQIDYSYVKQDGLYLVIRPWRRGDVGVHRGITPEVTAL